MTLGEEKLYNAFRDIEQREIEEYLEEFQKAPKPFPSHQYRKKKKSVLDRIYQTSEKSSPLTNQEPASTRRVTKKSIRIALLVAALVLLLSFSAFAAQQVYEFYHVVDNPTDSDVFLSPDPNTKSDLFGKYTYIPEGFELVEKNRSLWFRSEELIYQNTSGDLIVCRSGMITPRGVHSFNTEKGELKEISINKSAAKYLVGEYEDSSVTSLIWITGNTWHTVDGDNVSISEIKKIAENRK